MRRTTKLVAAGAGTLALAGGIGAGVSYAAGPTPTPGPTAAPSARPTAKMHRALLARALHGEVTLGGAEHRVVDFQRGTVEAVSATSLTVKSEDGFTATYVLGSTTTVRKAKAAATVADIHNDSRVRVLATKDGTTLTAQRVGLPQG